jgi:hypothetical protein
MIFRLVMLLVLLVSAGCASRVPVAKNHPLTGQYKAKAAHHWDVLADDIARQTQTAASGLDSPIKGTPLYIKPPEKNSAFSSAFGNFLITRLVNRGLPVTSNAEEGLAISYETQLLRHDSSRYTHLPGTLTALAAGIWVVRNIASSTASAIPTSLAITGLADYALGHYAGEATHTELIVTTSILHDASYVFRRSDIYYIEDEDTDLFAAEAPDRPVKQLGVVAQ